MIVCDLFLYMYESRRTIQSLTFGSYIFLLHLHSETSLNELVNGC